MLHSIVHFEHLRDVSEQIYQGGPDKGQAHLVVQAGLDEEGFLFFSRCASIALFQVVTK